MKKILLFLGTAFFLFSCASPSTKPIEKEQAPITTKEDKILVKNFSYQGEGSLVYLAGNFNQWKINDPQFAFILSNATEKIWTLSVPIAKFLKGENQYKLIVDGQWVLDPLAQSTKETLLAGKVGVFILP